MLEKTYNPSEIEARIYPRWERSGAFKAGVHAPKAGAGTDGAKDAPSYAIVIPPPNVTGSLHMGHALNNTLQDILVRFERMRGKDVVWQPGTDHAGIATQMVVERQLAERGEPDRRTLGREAFIERVWEWKEASGGNITAQLKRLGASCDWSRERFTMDDGLSAAVRKTFVELYARGLIYRGKRLVNWDPRFETAISDLEVENVEVDGHMWHFKYPLAGGATYEYVERDADGNITLKEQRDYISIATTRPETMLGDGAVAVHPDDERYAPIVGKLCEIPVGPKEHRRLIPIITDEYPDPDFGSGAVKITGAHDFNDYAVAKRGDIPMYRLMDGKGCMRSDGAPYAEAATQAKELASAAGAPDVDEVDLINLVPDQYRGLDRFDARAQVIADIDADGLMIRVEEKKIQQPFGDRSRVVIEPMLTDQWFVDAATLAAPAIDAVRTGETTFVPGNWDKTYYNWLENIEPWCISRRLWWGHQIPAWYAPDGSVFVAETEGEALDAARAQFGKDVPLTRDEDVLDTWFSSALWPFSTLGWPEDTPELAKYYPTTTLVTGFDIIFFWVARMMMMGLHFQKEIPFHNVYIHALVRDENGDKMSKSEGNVIDPVDLIQGIDVDTLIEKRTTGLRQPEKAPRVAKETRKKYPNGFDAYGADALRFTLAAMAAQGRDLKLSVERVEGYRNFATKLWNASRFAEMNECVRDADFNPHRAELTVSRWIAGETERTVAEITEALEAFRFNDAASAAYRFIWNVFCDWYLELIKPILNGDNSGAKAEIRAMTAWVLDQLLAMLHPFMPFITEELWGHLGEMGPEREAMLIASRWPELEGLHDQTAAGEIAWVIDLINEIRSVRSQMNVPAGAKLTLEMVGVAKQTRQRAEYHEETLKRLANLDTTLRVKKASSGALQLVVAGETFALPIGDVIDLDAERARLGKEIAKVESEIDKLEKKLSNEQFLAKAADHVIAEQRSRRETAVGRCDGLKAALERLDLVQ